ncbi:MAG: hypothetical protein QOI54_2948 [Actinomycetota bacterium]|jgi:hypothetical protein|nr:hypothetical protein [Actinomycetota bacterium]
MTARIALATAAAFPDLDEESRLLVAALGEIGLSAEPAIWSDPRIDWSAYDLVVVRCTWDYQQRHGEYLAWADQVAASTALTNPAAVLRWNTDKTYLRDLASVGLPVIETAWLQPGDTVVLPRTGEYVVKPAVSAGSRDTNRYVGGRHDDRAVAHAASLLAAGRTVMVQPYLAQVDTYGESALLYLDGRLSHAVRKGPLLEPAMAFVEGAYKQETIEAREPTAAERAVAESVLDALADVAPAGRSELTYARVDLVPDAGGSPTLLELELTEPSMFLDFDGCGGSVAAPRFAAAIRARLGG